MTTPIRWELLRAACLASLCAGTSLAIWSAPVDVDVREPGGKPVSGAIVFLDSSAAKKAVRPMAGIEVAQEKKQFLPDVLAITVGTEVLFPNHDAVRHHVYSFSPAKKFELKLYKGTPSAPVLFDQPGVVVLGCNIHDQMVGWMLVLETPYFAKTDTSGRASLADVPPGSYRLRTWHPGLAVGAPAHEQSLVVGSERAAKAAVVSLGRLTP